MVDESDDTKLAARLKHITGDVAKRESRRSARIGVASVALIAALSAGAWYASTLMQREARRPALPVASSSEFPQDEVAFATPPMPERPQPVATPAAPLAVNDNTAREIEALQARVAALSAQLLASKAEAEQGVEQRDAALIAFQGEMQEELARSRAAAEAAEQREADLARELQLMALDKERALLDQQAQLQRAMALSPAQPPAQRPQPGARDPDLARADAELREAERLAELQEAEAARQALIHKSAMVALSGTASGASENAGAERALGARESFVAAARPVQVTTAGRIARPDLTLPQGTIIAAALESAIDSSLPGPIRAVITDDVFSIDGSRVLIPRGSRLFGAYQSDVGLGDKRVLIAWSRIVTPRGDSVELTAYGTDGLGRSGLSGAVDGKFWERFGAAAVLSIIGVTPDLAAQNLGSAPAQDALKGAAGGLQQATGGLIGDYLRIRPTIAVPQGAIVTVVIDRDILIP